MTTGQYKKELSRVLAGIRDPHLMQDFLEDLLTPGEFTELGKRLALVRQLDHGVPQREIAKRLGVGIATVTRGSRELQNLHGGFRMILDRLNHTQ